MYQPMGNVVIKFFTSCKILLEPIKVVHWSACELFCRYFLFRILHTPLKNSQTKYRVLSHATKSKTCPNFTGVPTSLSTAGAPCRDGRCESFCQISLIFPPTPGSSTPVAVRIRRGPVRPNRICESPSRLFWHLTQFRLHYPPEIWSHQIVLQGAQRILLKCN